MLKIVSIIHPVTECDKSEKHSFGVDYKIPENWPEAKTSGQATKVDLFIAGDYRYGFRDAYGNWNSLTI